MRNAHQAAGGDPNDESIRPPSTSAADRLRWMLGRTMGRPQAFELRRQELERERRDAAEAKRRIFRQNSDNDNDNDKTQQEEEAKIHVSDDDVVRSYRKSCHPSTGEIGNYLSNANLALRIGELFVVHGALPLTREVLQKQIGKDTTDFWKDMTFAMPWLKEGNGGANPAAASHRATAKEAINAWIDSLNKFAKQALHFWQRTHSTESGSRDKNFIWALRGGYPADMPACQLMQYGMGWTADGKRNPTVVYSSFSVDGVPKRFYPEEMEKKSEEDHAFVECVKDFFMQSGIKLILAGHQPQGDMPFPIRIEYDSDTSSDGTPSARGLGWVLCCDTSYSGDTNWYSPQEGEQRKNPGRGKGPGFRGDLAVR